VPGITGAEPDLRAIVDFGWLNLIARPLFLWLKWTHDHVVRNWGWAIVIQTLIINLALLPLRITQMKSMLRCSVCTADQGDPGEIQEVQPSRSSQSGNESGGFRHFIKKKA